MRNAGVFVLTCTVILTMILAGCSGGGGRAAEAASDAKADEQTEPELPVVTTLQAEQAVSDAMLISGLALFLVFRAEEGARSISNEEGTLTLEWDDNADFNSGVGMYTITATEYMIPEDDPFGADYNGYVLTGTVVTGSSDGISATMDFDLRMSHEDSETFPVQTLALHMKSTDLEEEEAASGTVYVNGHEMNIGDLAQAMGAGT